MERQICIINESDFYLTEYTNYVWKRAWIEEDKSDNFEKKDSNYVLEIHPIQKIQSRF